MGFGGIIFVAILGLWAVYLLPVLVKERAARLDNRAAERSSAAARVLQRPAAQRPSRRVVLTVDRPLVSDDLPALPTPGLAASLRQQARRSRTAVRVRGLAALGGLVALVVATAAAVAGALPWWATAVGGGWLTGVLLIGGASARARRRAVAPPARAAALPPRAHRVATEVFDDRASRPSRPAPSVVGVESPSTAAAPAAAGATWTPVEVPGPVYASKPVSHRPPALPWSMPAPAASAAGSSVDDGSATTAATEQPVAAPAAREHAADGEPDDRQSATG